MSGAETVIQTYFDQLTRGNPTDLGTSIETVDLDIQHWFRATGMQKFTAGAGLPARCGTGLKTASTPC